MRKARRCEMEKRNINRTLHVLIFMIRELQTLLISLPSFLFYFIPKTTMTLNPVDSKRLRDLIIHHVCVCLCAVCRISKLFRGWFFFHNFSAVLAVRVENRSFISLRADDFKYGITNMIANFHGKFNCEDDPFWKPFRSFVFRENIWKWKIVQVFGQVFDLFSINSFWWIWFNDESRSDNFLVSHFFVEFLNHFFFSFHFFFFLFIQIIDCIKKK